MVSRSRVRVRKLRAWIRTQGLVWLAGLALVVVGSLCLSLSAAVARTGSWWQGTLDALGVGAIAGGVVDVLAITGLNAVLSGQEKRREFNLQAKSLLESYQPNSQVNYAHAARQILERSGGNIDRQLRTRLEEVITGAAAKESEERHRDLEERRRLLQRQQRGLGMPSSAQAPAETPDLGDAPPAPGIP